MAYPGGMIPHMASGGEGLRLYFYGAWPHSYDWSTWKNSRIARIDYLRDGVPVNDEGEHITPVDGTGSIADTFDGSTATGTTYQFTDDLEERYLESIFPSGGYPDKIEIYQADTVAPNSFPPSSMELRYGGNVISRFSSPLNSQPSAGTKYIDHEFDLTPKATTDFRIRAIGAMDPELTLHSCRQIGIADINGSILTDFSKFAISTNTNRAFQPRIDKVDNAFFDDTGLDTVVDFYFVGEPVPYSYSWAGTNTLTASVGEFEFYRRQNGGDWELLHSTGPIASWSGNELKTFII